MRPSRFMESLLFFLKRIGPMNLWWRRRVLSPLTKVARRELRASTRFRFMGSVVRGLVRFHFDRFSKISQTIANHPLSTFNPNLTWLKVRNVFGRKGCAQSVQDGENVDRLLTDSAADGVYSTGRCDEHLDVRDSAFEKTRRSLAAR